jgi:hypothetical protein
MSELLNILQLCENYQTDGIKYGWLGRKNTKQKEKELLTIHVPYPDIDWCIRTKTYISYDEQYKQWNISDNLKLGQNHFINTLIDDVKNSRIDIKKYYIGNFGRN